MQEGIQLNKKFLSLMLVLVLVSLVIAGCGADKSEKEEDPAPSKAGESSGELQDGFYLVKMPVGDQDNYPLATMEVDNGEIIAFEYVEILADSGEEKNEGNYKYEEGLKVLANLNEQFNEKKDLDEVDFDAVSGATYTKESFKEIVPMLLEKAEKGEAHDPVYKDGEYEAKADEDSHGWLSEVKVIVKDGEIVGVDFYDVATEDMEGQKVVLDDENEPVMEGDEPKTEPTDVKKGDIKSLENYAYLPSFDTIKAIRKQIIENNGVEDLELDAVSGATNTKDTMIDLVTKALEEAE